MFLVPPSRIPLLAVVWMLAGAWLGCQPGDSAVNDATHSASVSVQADAEQVRLIESMTERPQVQLAIEHIHNLAAQTHADHILLTEIPAPPFKEEARARQFASMLDAAAADSVWLDDVGNVLALRKGTGENPRLVAIDAHLDTVFPEGTDVSVHISGDTLFAPGVGDDTRGLVVILTVLRVMEYAGLQTEDDILFVGTVGEEGLGDLRGAKHLFGEQGPGIDAWIAIDGNGLGTVVHRGLGSHRYRITFSGPGGHSWGAFGYVNPLHALGSTIEKFIAFADKYTRSGPKTSYNIGRMTGGTSVNAIPFAAWMEVDLRSVDQERLAGIDALLHEAVAEALDENNARRRNGPPLKVKIERIGLRPSGTLDPETPLVQRALAAAHHLGANTHLGIASTDSNIPISLNIPAITIGRGGSGGGAHSLREWWVDEEGYKGIEWALLTLLAEAGVVD